MARLILVLLISLLTTPLCAQEAPGNWPNRNAAEQPVWPATAAVPSNGAQAGSETGAVAPRGRWHEPVEIVFSVTVLVFGLALIVVFTNLVRREGKGWRTIYMRLVVLTIVVTAGLFVIVAGYTQDQIAPMMGLLGTLVGYLLGKEGAPTGPPIRPENSEPAL